MKAVLEILTGLGIDPSNPPHRDARLTIRNAPWMPLHIESIGSGPTGRQAWSVALSPTFRLRMPTSKGATASGQMMPASSWEASIMAATRRDGPMP